MSHRSNYYAVKDGRCPGVYSSGEECKGNVDGYSGAQFKKFSTYAEAQQSASNDRSYAREEAYGGTCSWTTEQRPIGGRGCTCVCTCGNGAPPPQKKQRSLIPLLTCENNGQTGPKGGIGVYFGPDHPMNISEPLQGRQTNNRAEITAGTRALEQCKKMGASKVNIRTDSNFLINGSTEWMNKSKENGWKLVNGQSVINREDFEKLDEARQGLDVKWDHVRDHQGVKGYEDIALIPSCYPVYEAEVYCQV